MLLTPETTAALRGHRETRWAVVLLDDADQEVRELFEFDEAAGVHLEQNRFREIRGGGSLELASPGGFGHIDWGRARLRVEQHLAGLDQPIPWGIYLPEKPATVWHDEQGLARATVTLMDKLAVPAQAAPRETYSIDEGANVVDAIVAILAGLGEDRVAVTDSALTMPAPRSWPISGDEMSWLGIINELLEVINYLALWCDADGVYQISPYRPAGPGDAPAWVFTYGDPDGAMYLPEWSEEEDWYGVPNVVTLQTQGDDQAPALTATAINTSPDSKYSTVRRGREIAAPRETVEAANQATLQGLAQRRLESLTTSVVNIGITTAPLPIWPNDRIDLVSPSRQMGTLRATSSSWTVDGTPGGLMTHTWREVVSLGGG